MSPHPSDTLSLASSGLDVGPAEEPASVKKKKGGRKEPCMSIEATKIMIVERIRKEESFNKVGKGDAPTKDSLWTELRDYLAGQVDEELPDIHTLQTKWYNVWITAKKYKEACDKSGADRIPEPKWIRLVPLLKDYANSRVDGKCDIIGTARETPSPGEWTNAGCNASQSSPIPVTPSDTGWIPNKRQRGETESARQKGNVTGMVGEISESRKLMANATTSLVQARTRGDMSFNNWEAALERIDLVLKMAKCHGWIGCSEELRCLRNVRWVSMTHREAVSVAILDTFSDPLSSESWRNELFVIYEDLICCPDIKLMMGDVVKFDKDCVVIRSQSCTCGHFCF